MFSYGSEELARHRQRELLDVATYIHNARQARARARRAAASRRARLSVASRFTRLFGARRHQREAVVPIPPRPARALRARAITSTEGDVGPPPQAADDDLLVA